MSEARDSFTIAEIAANAGVTPRTIRYYVAEGLLPPPEGSGQHRLYSGRHLRLLGAIKHLKDAYLPLVEIRRRLAHLSDADVECLTAPGADPISTGEPAVVPSHDPVQGSALGFMASFDGDSPTSNPVAHLYAGPRPGLSDSPTPHLGIASSRQISESTPARETAGASTVWHRVILAPGVEIHFQPSGDRRRDEAIAHVIRAATSLLSSVPRALRSENE